MDTQMFNDGSALNLTENDIEKLGYDTPATYASLQDQVNELKGQLSILTEKVEKIDNSEWLLPFQSRSSGTYSTIDLSKYKKLVFFCGYSDATGINASVMNIYDLFKTTETQVVVTSDVFVKYKYLNDTSVQITHGGATKGCGILGFI